MHEQVSLETEDLPPLLTFGEVEAYLDDPMRRELLLENLAGEFAYEIFDHMKGGDEAFASSTELRQHRLPVANFSHLFDPTLPTIVLDAGRGLLAHELIGVAAAERRENGEGLANVIYITTATDCARLVTGEDNTSRMVVTHGILIDAKGHTYAGELPVPVLADMFDTANRDALRQCADKGIPTISQPTRITKQELPGLAAAAKVLAPQRYKPEELATIGKPFVIKPNDAESGRGVRMFDGARDKADAQTYYEFLQKHRYEPVIEQRVFPTPLFIDGPEGKVAADWNARVLLYGGKVYDMYIRAGAPGGAINADQGASEFPISALWELTESPEEADIIFDQLCVGAHGLAQVVRDRGFTGGDITIDEALQPVVFEVNDGNVGGPRAIAHFETTRAQKLLNFDQLLRTWTAELPDIPTVDIYAHAGGEKIARDIVGYDMGLYGIGYYDGLALIDSREICAKTNSPWDYSLWLRSTYVRAAGAVTTQAEPLFQYLDGACMHLAPLEFPRVLLDTAILRHNPAKLLEYANLYEPLMPTDKYWADVRIAAYSLLDMPDVARQVAASLITQGKTTSESIAEFMASFVGPHTHEVLDLQRNRSDLWNLPRVCKTYVTRGYPWAIAELDEAIANPVTPGESAVAARFALSLSLGAGDSARAQYYTALLVEQHHTMATYRLLTHTLGSRDNPVQLAAAVECLPAMNIHFSALLRYLELAGQGVVSNALAMSLAPLIAARLQQPEQASALQLFLQNAVANPLAAQPLQEGPLGLFTQAIAIDLNVLPWSHIATLTEVIRKGQVPLQVDDDIELTDYLATLADIAAGQALAGND